MDFIIGLFWIGVWISLALFIFNLIFTFGMVILMGIGSGIYWVFCKLTRRVY